MAREAEYQGISVEEAIKQHEEAEAAAEARAREQEAEEKRQQQTRPKPTRPVSPEKIDPAVRFENAQKEGELHGEWGSGDEGYKVPQTPSERMRSAWSMFFAYNSIEADS